MMKTPAQEYAERYEAKAKADQEAKERQVQELTERVSALETALKQEETAADRTIWNLTQENIRLRSVLEQISFFGNGTPAVRTLVRIAREALQSQQIPHLSPGKMEDGTPLPPERVLSEHVTADGGSAKPTRK